MPDDRTTTPLLPPQEDTTIAELDETLLYVIQELIRLPDSSVIYHQDEVVEILDLVTMRETDISQITGIIDGRSEVISKRDARLLLHFVWWHQDLSSQMLNNTVNPDIWLEYEREDFIKF